MVARSDRRCCPSQAFSLSMFPSGEAAKFGNASRDSAGHFLDKFDESWEISLTNWASDGSVKDKEYVSVLVNENGGAYIRETHGDFDRCQDTVVDDAVVPALIKLMVVLFQTRFLYCLKFATWLLMLEDLAAFQTLQAATAP